MKQWFLEIYANAWLAGLLYWLPMAFCAFGYLVRTARNFAKDRRARVQVGGYYHPTDTVGSLLGRAVMTILPIGNLFAAIFDVAPDLLGRFFKWLHRVFDQPLVPDLPDGKERRAVPEERL
jgi:hypothetical protein